MKRSLVCLLLLFGSFAFSGETVTVIGIRPNNDAIQTLGTPGYRYSQVYATAISDGMNTIQVSELRRNSTQLEGTVLEVSNIQNDLTQTISDVLLAQTDILDLQTGLATASATITGIQADLDAAGQNISNLQTDMAADITAIQEDIAALQQAVNASKIVRRTAILTAAGWTGTAAPWTQMLSIENKATGFAGFAAGATREQFDAASSAGIWVSARDNMTITFSALNEVPTIDIPVEYIGAQ